MDVLIRRECLNWSWWRRMKVIVWVLCQMILFYTFGFQGQLILKIQFVTWWVRFIYSILLLFSFGNNNLDKYLLNHINQSYHTICLVEKEVMLWLYEKCRQIITKNLLKLVLELRSQICYILLVFILLIYA